MKPMTKAVAVALIQVLIVCSLGAKLLYDRKTRPRAWFKAARYDPNLPLRGRYLRLQIELNDSRSPEEIEKKFSVEIQTNENRDARYGYPIMYDFGSECGSIVLRGGRPTAEFEEGQAWNCENLTFVRRRSETQTVLRLTEPVLFFISDTAKDPTRLATGEELWVLATIPRKGPPRPIALGVKKPGETVIRRLDID